MSAAFKSMSDLLADSEDLLARIGRSKIPQVRALLEPFSRSVDQLKTQLRQRAKRIHKLPIAAAVERRPRELQVISAITFLASIAVVWFCNRGKRRW